jgi:hypothetical protein
MELPDFEAWRLSDVNRAFADPYYKELVQEAIPCVCFGRGGSDSGWATGPLDRPPGPKNDPWRPCDGIAEGYLIRTSVRQNFDGEYRTHSLLQTIRQNIGALKHFEGIKSIALFSDGFLSMRDTATAYQLQELIDLALRSGVTINTVSTRGIPSYADYLFGQWWKMHMLDDDMAMQYSPLEQMAKDTGGLFHGGNDMHKPLREIARRPSHYYVLTYAMPKDIADGAYHHIKLEVMRPGLKISFRDGYYTPKEELAFENSKKEDILEALNDVGNMNEIPMTLAYNYSQEDDSTYVVSFVTNVNIRNLKFPEEDARRKNSISLVLVAFDETDNYISGLEKSIDFQLQESNYVSLRNQGLSSEIKLNLPVGRYKIKAVVRESTEGKMGSITKAVEIP